MRPGIERLEHAEGLGGAKGAVVGQQHAAGADAQALGFGAQPREQHLGTGIGERSDRVVLGEPVAVVAELFDAARERERFLDRAARVVAVMIGDWSRTESRIRIGVRSTFQDTGPT